MTVRIAQVSDAHLSADKPFFTGNFERIAEAIRAFGVAQGVPTAALSRGVCGFAGHTLLVNLPGSAGGARDGLHVLAGLLVHALEQNLGSDHRRVSR